MENNEKILFDPGYAPLVIDSIGAVGYTYYMFSASNNVKLKKINFPSVSRKIDSLLKENVAFYLGCLLWGSYISTIENAEIQGNKLLGEEAKEEEYTSEISFLIELVEYGLNRDYKYYTGKNYEPDKRFLPVLKAYKDFLIINSGFTACSNTSQIKIPDCLKKPDDIKFKEINELIQAAISTKDILKLFEGYDFLF